MAIYVTEAEMIERYIDGLKKASSRASEFLTVEEKEKPSVFIDFIDGLKVSAGSAHQLAHAQMNPNFLGIRDLLEKIIELGKELPVFGPEQNHYWVMIKQSLDEMVIKGRREATSHAMKRQDVLANLDLRQQKLITNVE